MTKTLSTVVDNNTIGFASFRPPGSTTALLVRKIRVIAPGSLVTLIQNENLSLLPALIELLKDPAKAWAAEIILTALTDGEGKTIESFDGEPGRWWESIGSNAYKKWMDWYEQRREDLVWNKEKMLVEMKK